MCEHANNVCKIIRHSNTTRHYELNTPVFVWIAFQILQFELSCFMSFLVVWMYGKLTAGGYLYASVKLGTLEDLLLTKNRKGKTKKLLLVPIITEYSRGEKPSGRKVPWLVDLIMSVQM